MVVDTTLNQSTEDLCSHLGSAVNQLHDLPTAICPLSFISIFCNVWILKGPYKSPPFLTFSLVLIYTPQVNVAMHCSYVTFLCTCLHSLLLPSLILDVNIFKVDGTANAAFETSSPGHPQEALTLHSWHLANCFFSFLTNSRNQHLLLQASSLFCFMANPTSLMDLCYWPIMRWERQNRPATIFRENLQFHRQTCPLVGKKIGEKAVLSPVSEKVLAAHWQSWLLEKSLTSKPVPLRGIPTCLSQKFSSSLLPLVRKPKP